MITAAHNSPQSRFSAPVTFANGWLAFELAILRRLKFDSIALPFTGEPDLCVQLKRWKVRIAANDPMLWSCTKATALVENANDKLTDQDQHILLDDAYMPREKLDNPSLLNWFNESDAWWFDNVRFNAERLETPYKRALALTAGILVGDYVLSFNDETRSMREPLSLSNVFRMILQESLPRPYDNALRNRSSNQDVRSFLAERYSTDLLFLRLPPPVVQSDPVRTTVLAWREEWIRGGDEFWDELEHQRAGKLGSRVQSKQQYLDFVEDLIRTAAHIPNWVVAHCENGFISTEELVETISRVRKVDAIYAKDFSELLGVKGSIVTAVS
jgi:hypothetical protein